MNNPTYLVPFHSYMNSVSRSIRVKNDGKVRDEHVHTRVVLLKRFLSLGAMCFSVSTLGIWTPDLSVAFLFFSIQ